MRRYYRKTPSYNARGHWQVWERRGWRWRWSLSTPSFADLQSIIRAGELWFQARPHRIVWVPPKEGKQ